MKRIIAVVLVLAFCFSLCGCSLIKRECEYCHNAVGEYREDGGIYDYLCDDCYYDHVLEDDYDLDDYTDYYDDDDDYYYYSNNYCDNCGDKISANRNYCDDCLEDFLDSLDNY